MKHEHERAIRLLDEVMDHLHGMQGHDLKSVWDEKQKLGGHRLPEMKEHEIGEPHHPVRKEEIEIQMDGKEKPRMEDLGSEHRHGGADHLPKASPEMGDDIEDDELEELYKPFRK